MAVLWCVVLAVVATQGVQTGAPPVAQGSGLIVGQVVDAATDKPVPNAIVIIDASNLRVRPERRLVGGPIPGPSAILTGSDGRFVFRDLPAGAFTINAQKVGYSDGAYGRRRPGGASEPVRLADGERRGDIVVRLWKRAAISGRVTDEAGEPAVAVQVHAFRRNGSRAANTMTDDRGIYRLGLLDAGEYVVGIVPRNASAPVAVVQAARRGADSNLVAGLNGTSLPGTPQAIQIGELVHALGAGAPIPPHGAGGRVSVYPPTFYASAFDFAQAATVKVTSGEERDAIDLQLVPAPTVRVSGIVSGMGESAGVPVRLVPAAYAQLAIEAEVPSTVSDRFGAFTFAAVPSGDYILRATLHNRQAGYDVGRNDDLQFAEMRVTVGQTHIDGIAVSLRPGMRITGRFEFEGASPRPGSLGSVGIVVESAGGSLVAPIVGNSARATAAGTFGTVPLGPGRYYVRITGSPRGWMFKSATLNGRDVADIPIEITSSDVTDVVVTFSDRWSGLQGVVLTGTGAPDPDALVIAFPTDPQTWSSTGLNPRRVRSVRATPTGQYAFATLPPGDYYVAAIPGEYGSDWRDAAFLEALTGSAHRISIADGERPNHDLRTLAIR